MIRGTSHHCNGLSLASIVSTYGKTFRDNRLVPFMINVLTRDLISPSIMPVLPHGPNHLGLSVYSPFWRVGGQAPLNHSLLALPSGSLRNFIPFTIDMMPTCVSGSGMLVRSPRKWRWMFQPCQTVAVIVPAPGMQNV